MLMSPLRSRLFPYTTLFRSGESGLQAGLAAGQVGGGAAGQAGAHPGVGAEGQGLPRGAAAEDRKSTRLNSSHVATSYAVFCLKKKNNIDNHNIDLLFKPIYY